MPMKYLNRNIDIYYIYYSHPVSYVENDVYSWRWLKLND